MGEILNLGGKGYKFKRVKGLFGEILHTVYIKSSNNSENKIGRNLFFLF